MIIVPFIRLFYGVHSSFYYRHGWHVEGITIIESSLSMRQGDPLRGPRLKQIKGSRPRQGFAKVQIKSEARESHFMLPGG